MSVIIKESGLLFGEYPDADVFQIEKSAIYQKLSDNVKAVEFILKRDEKTILWVEAKSSSPNPKNTENAAKFDLFLSEVCKKFEHSLSLFVSAILKRIPDTHNEISRQLREMDYEKVSFKLILVIKGHNEIWLQPIADGLKRKLITCMKIWHVDPIKDIVVINDEGAKHYNLTVSEILGG
jgi:hypothetical protein